MGKANTALAVVLLILLWAGIGKAMNVQHASAAENPQTELETATLGGGCFWCIEAVFAELDGVSEAVSGYAGGSSGDPSYDEVCSGDSGHAEVVQVTFDPQRISFEEILAVFFSVHDPTTRDRQGADIGTQYRSLILHHDERQRYAALELIQRLEAEKVWPNPVLTQVEPFAGFHPAEKYHQDYYERNRSAGYCQVVIAPKLEKFRREFSDRLNNK